MSTITPPRILPIVAAQIDFEDRSFCLRPDSPAPPSEQFLESLRRVGVLLPPIVKEKAPRSHQIVSGEKRLHAIYENLEQKQCSCLVLPIDTPPETVLGYALEELLLKGKPSPVEEAIFLQKILAHLDEEEVARCYLPRLGLKPHRTMIHKTLKYLQLEEPLLMALHGGFLDETAAQEMVDLPFTDRMSLFDLIDYLHLSVSNQKKLIRICRELAGRAGCNIIEILALPVIKDIIQHPQANAPQKTANLMATLNELRFPRLAEAESAFKQFVGSLKLGKNVTVSHSPHFEKDELTLAISFPDQSSLTASWPTIKTILDR